VHPAFPARTIAEFIEVARRDGDKLNFAAAGAGTSNHLFSELIQSQLGLHWTTVQYKGTAPAMTDLIGGHVQFSIDQISSSLSLIRDGKVRALAVSSARRLSSLPEVPTFVENGYTNLEGYTFVAVLGPARTPDAIVRKLATAIGKVVHDPEVARQIAELGAEPAAMSPEEFRAYLEKEDTVWLPIVRATKPQ
jgi:tripartite-type tricarboxylate transporter receptor subunit TctC